MKRIVNSYSKRSLAAVIIGAVLVFVVSSTIAMFHTTHPGSASIRYLDHDSFDIRVARSRCATTDDLVVNARARDTESADSSGVFSTQTWQDVLSESADELNLPSWCRPVLTPRTVEHADENWYVSAQGWPLRAFASVGHRHRLSSGDRIIRIDRVRDGIMIGQQFPDFYRAIPLRLLWIGFAINTLLYGAFVFLCMLVGGRVRAAVRLWKGRCPVCNYRLFESNEGAGCPECGWNRPTHESPSDDATPDSQSS